MTEYFNYSSESEEWEAIEAKDDDQSPISDLEFIMTNAIEELVPAFAFTEDHMETVALKGHISISTADKKKIDVSSDSDDDGTASSVIESSLPEEHKVITSFFNQNDALFTEEEEENSPSGPLFTKNEIIGHAVLYPVEDGTVVEPTDELVEIGSVLCCLEESLTIIIRAAIAVPPLSEGSLVCDAAGVVLGRVQEVFGPVATPFYVVARTKQVVAASTESAISKQNNIVDSVNVSKKQKQTNAKMKKERERSKGANNDIDMENIATTSSLPSLAVSTATDPVLKVPFYLLDVGSAVFSPTKQTTFISAATLASLRAKGSDASNVYDEEPAENELEYSDDEAEMLAKQATKTRKKSEPRSASNVNVNKITAAGRRADAGRRGPVAQQQTTCIMQPVSYAAHREANIIGSSPLFISQYPTQFPFQAQYSQRPPPPPPPMTHTEQHVFVHNAMQLQQTNGQFGYTSAPLPDQFSYRGDILAQQQQQQQQTIWNGVIAEGNGVNFNYSHGAAHLQDFQNYGTQIEHSNNQFSVPRYGYDGSEFAATSHAPPVSMAAAGLDQRQTMMQYPQQQQPQQQQQQSMHMHSQQKPSIAALPQYQYRPIDFQLINNGASNV